MEPNFKDATSELVSLILVSHGIPRILTRADLSLQLRTVTAQTQESLVTGAERDHCQIYQPEEEIEVQAVEDLDLSLVESAVSAENVHHTQEPRATARFETLATGSVEVHCPHFHNKSEAQAMAAARCREETMVPKERASEIASHPQLNGVRVDLQHQDHKMKARDHQDASSRRGRSLNELQLLLNRIINGVPRCALILPPPSLLSLRAMEARHLRRLLQDQLHLQAAQD